MTQPAGPMCPMPGDGRHKLYAQDWGMGCSRCHKTWEWWRAGDLVPTWNLNVMRGLQASVNDPATAPS